MGRAWRARAGFWLLLVWSLGGVGISGADPRFAGPPPGQAAAFSPPGGPRIAGVWRVLPLPEAPLAGEIVFYDRQFEGRAGCGRFFGSYERMDPWFRIREPFLEGRCEMEAEVLERLKQAARLIRRGASLEFSDASGRVLLRLSPM